MKFGIKLIKIVAGFFLFLAFAIVAVIFTVRLYQVKQEQRATESKESSLVVTKTGAVNVTTLTHEGHDYIIVDAGYGAGIIHSESCPCKTSTENNSINTQN